MPSHEDVAALRSQLWQNGYRPVAVYTQGKRPFGNAWQERARQNPPGAVTEPVNDAALSTGILCDGLRAIDIDIDDSAIASEVERIAYGILGTAPARRRADSARALLLYRAVSGEPCKRTIEGTMGSVEALGHGQQFVAFGTHEQGQPYTWAVSPAPYSVNAITAITEDALTAFLGAIASLIGSQAVQPAPVAYTGAVAAPVDPALVTDADRAYALAALQDEYARLCAVTSSRNNAINCASHALGTLIANGSLNEADAFSALFEAATMNGYTQKPDGINRATKTIYSGLTSGKAKPRLLPSQTAPAHIAELRANLAGQNLKTTAPQASLAPSIGLVGMDEIEEKPITWLWNGFIPRGKLTLLAGAGGTGKSTIAFNLAAIISNGGMWPDGTRCNLEGNTLIWSSEDDPADVIKPRLKAMDAKTSRIAMIQTRKTQKDVDVPFDPARDMDALRNQVKRFDGNISLLIIDPIVSAVTGDMHKTNDTRHDLQAVVNFASEMNCAVIGITHFAKGTAGRDPVERVIGSQAFAAYARMVLVAAKDENTDNRVFTRAKSNNSPVGDGFNYTIEEAYLHRGIVTTRIVWGDAIKGSSREILATVEKGDGPKHPQPQRKEAKAFLHEELKNGPRPARELIEQAKNQLGISADTLRSAKEELGIVASKAGYQGLWMWSYPCTPKQPMPAFGL